MTIQELYAKIDGNYEHAIQIMRMDKLVDRYVRKLAGSGAYDSLVAAGETLDPTAMFESAHVLKGVTANLGLDGLAAKVGVITEEFRPGNARSLSDDAVKAALAEVGELYQKTLAGIREYEESNK